MENEKPTKMKTYFAPAERAENDVLEKQINFFSKQELLKKLYNSISDIILVLNRERQTIFFNEKLIKELKLDVGDDFYGKRPGEILNCEHAMNSEGGCGTTEFCKTCGAVKAILNSHKGIQDIQECRVIQKETGDALDLQVIASPFEIENEIYTIFSIKDISNEKRRKVLERIFFHDILNTAGSVRSISELLQDATDEDIELYRDLLYKSSDKLIDEILGQRDLVDAENNELKLNLSEAQSKHIIHNSVDIIKMHQVAKNKNFIVDELADNFLFTTDKSLLTRVIINLLKNAVEASPEKESVYIGCNLLDEYVEFWVKNNSFIPRDIQLQLFKRSFSTKGKNRGLGTYSIKLLTERYLKGEVRFETNEKTGTIFYVKYPKTINA